MHGPLDYVPVLGVQHQLSKSLLSLHCNIPVFCISSSGLPHRLTGIVSELGVFLDQAVHISEACIPQLGSQPKVANVKGVVHVVLHGRTEVKVKAESNGVTYQYGDRLESKDQNQSSNSKRKIK